MHRRVDESGRGYGTRTLSAVICMAHTRRHRYCPSCNTNLDVLGQLVRDMQDISTIIGGGGIALGKGLLGRDELGFEAIRAGEAAADLYDRYQEIKFPGNQRSAGPNLASSSGGIRMVPSRGKKKRKVSKYQREFGRQLKALKKKHPRTSIGILMRRAHRATKRALK